MTEFQKNLIRQKWFQRIIDNASMENGPDVPALCPMTRVRDTSASTAPAVADVIAVRSPPEWNQFQNSVTFSRISSPVDSGSLR